MWSKHVCDFCFLTVLIGRWLQGMATGSSTGQICLWDILKERETERVKVRGQTSSC